jgi:hypothetical protein
VHWRAKGVHTCSLSLPSASSSFLISPSRCAMFQSNQCVSSCDRLKSGGHGSEEIQRLEKTNRT